MLELKRLDGFAGYETTFDYFLKISNLSINDGVIVGWTSLSKWSDRCAYSNTAEISLYVNNCFMGKGIGKKLMEHIIKKGESVGLHVLIARITEGNENSIHLHESFGFEHIGIMQEVGNKFGKLLDVYLMQKIYKI